ELGRIARAPEWKRVGNGLFLIYVAACLVLAAYDIVIAAAIVAQVLLLFGAVAVVGGVLVAALATAGAAGVGAVVVSMIGHTFCCLAPQRKGGQALGITCTALLGLNAFIGLISGLMASGGSAPVPLVVGGAILALGQLFVFLF